MNDINIVLAERSGIGAARLCGCDCIHLRIGPVTISMTPDMFSQAAQLMNEAMESLSIIASAREIGEESLHARAMPN